MGHFSMMSTRNRTRKDGSLKDQVKKCDKT